MLSKKDLIHAMILSESESECLDYKADSYRENEALLKDILAMANSLSDGSKYIITGVKDVGNGIKDIRGISPNMACDDANYQQLVLNNIEPDIKFQYYPIMLSDNKVLGVFELKDNNQRPYVLKKQYGRLHAGLCLIRKGSQQCQATRSDFELFYSQREVFEVRILEPYMSCIGGDGLAQMRVSLRNLTQRPVTIIRGGVLIKDERGEIRSRHRLYGVHRFIGAEFTIGLMPTQEEVGYLYLNFESSDCFRLGIDEYGYSDEKFIFRLELIDTEDKLYSAEIGDGVVFAKGEVLWKVKLRAEKEGADTRPLRRKPRDIFYALLRFFR